MMEQAALDQKQQRGRRTLVEVLQSLNELNGRLRRTVNGNALSLPEVAPDLVEEAVQRIDLAIRDLGWLRRQMKERQAVERLKMEVQGGTR